MITFEPIKKNKTALLNIIIDRANSLLESKTLTIFYLNLQSFIDSLKLTNYQLQPKDIFVLDRLPNPDRIEFFKRDGKGDLVFLTSFKMMEAEATPSIEMQGSEQNTLYCHICNDKAEMTKANPNLYAGFFDADLNVFVCDYTSCKETHYYRKSKALNGVVNGKVSGKHNFSEVPISIGSEHIFIEKINKAGTTTPKLESKKNSDLSTSEKVLTLGEALRPDSYWYFSTKELLKYHPELDKFINNGIAGQIVNIQKNNYEKKCFCTFCNNGIDEDTITIKHNGSDLFYFYCEKCANELNFLKFGLPTEETPKTDVLAKVESLSINEKIALINKARWPHVEKEITWDDFTKIETHLFYPFYVFENFHANEKLLYCDCCGELFEGNGSYATAFFVFHNADDLKIYCSKSEFDYYNTIEYLDMLHGYKKPIQLTHKYIGSIEHELIFSLIYKAKRYKLNNYVPNGFKTVQDLRNFIDFGDGGGSSIRDGFCDYKGLSVKYASKNDKFKKTTFSLVPSDTLRIVNEILADNKFQTKITKTDNTTTSDTTPIEKTPNLEPTTPKQAIVKKQIAIKPSELPPVKAMQKNNSKSINDTYAGGKNASGVYQFLINHVPPVKCIVSGFLGHCGLLKNIKPAKMMVGIDKDILVTDRWNKEDLGVKLITGDFLNNLEWVNPARFGETLVFLDPPYLDETRSSQGKLYNFTFGTSEQHKTLLEKAIKFPCYVMITAYENELYNAYLDGKNGFTKHYFNGNTQRGRKQECMYINYEVPTKLHDYKFYGTDYRERWNNKKLIDRTISQLKDMPPLRRNMVIDAILNQQF